jgi:predicted MPP superfamily phosphohydrolase
VSSDRDAAGGWQCAAAPLTNRLVDRRTFLKRSAAVAGASGVGCFIYAIGVEPHWLDFEYRELRIDHLPRALDGATLMQVSDLHIGPRVSDSYLVDSLTRAAALRPDIVIFTGDFISHQTPFDDLLSRVRDVLSQFPRGRLGTFGILGNHDYGIRWRDPAVAASVTAEAERAGIHMLRNDVHQVAGLDVIGLDDLWAQRCDPGAAMRRRASNAAIALVHNPDAADERPWHDFRGWMFAGHTHGGQCKPPFLPPPILPVNNRRYTAGMIAVDAHRTLYISRGVGHLIRARFNVRPEIGVFTLRPQVT